MSNSRLALIGARGYTGRTLLELLLQHPGIELALATSGSKAGRPIREQVPAWPDADQVFIELAPESVDEVDADIWVLALPNGHSAPWVAAIESARPDALVLDLGADWRFDEQWVYGLTEFNRDAIAGARRIANPGCYATAALFGLLPIRRSLASPPVVFGVSGYSGAGSTPSPRNDPDRLHDNLMPYALTGHVHESEISTHLARPVRFHPHVAPFFRGISATLSVTLTETVSASELRSVYAERLADEPLIEVCEAIPEIRQVANTPRLAIGGFSVDQRDPMRATFVVVLDNLLKGAASQALQNINLALGFDELAGI
ncbi:N-acetyl-gamma-glutamyl-phosphate reductase [Wenzhouxiangella sp. AB-CW3]|uniref:N-acetyl-gamma-glutamyl-phosphate reductase n=1 Tax=Wenzhouxiangella sp. AB-CW3 TaxID=2771012 RepID=UPI00168B6AFA|nr:N-acetyl-gamma-glutamyl-phosphate reductase [Wenzhouxiangella sp. AB-CW3]QOC22710.1 N-acetyl-gamma-glutamyl-phosphate reductase [Wenzhouxiangella sp. AB-CW3]